MSRPPEIEAALADYNVVIEVPIWWGDQDAFGHVNNTIPLKWFESSRIAYMGQVGLSRLYETQRVGPILASITTNYRRQMHYPDLVYVGARVSKIGRTSLSMDHVAISRESQVVSVDGTSTLVVIDYSTGRPSPVPQEIRDAIESLEGKSVS